MKKGKKLNHTACRKGKRVIIKLRNGLVIRDVFEERKGGTIFLRDFGRVHKKDMASFKINRNEKRLK